MLLGTTTGGQAGAVAGGDPVVRGARSPAASSDLAGQRYAIVGGGVSGLAAAWYLQQRGAQTHIIERDTKLGGRVASGELGDRTITLGGKNIGRSYLRFRAFTAAHGSPEYEYFGINSSRVMDGRLVTFDSNHRARLLRECRHISPRDAVRLVRLLRWLRHEPEARFLGGQTCAALADRYGMRTVHDLFGERLRELLLRSLTVRVSAAELDEVPMTNVLPYLAMLLDSYEQLADGMQEVIDAAARRSQLSLATEATGLIVEQGRVCGVQVSSSGGVECERVDGVVVSTPAHEAARLLKGVAPPQTAALMREVRYFPVVVLLVEYERPAFSSDVRAIVFGPESALSNAGAYGVKDLNVVRYTFSGRKARSLVEREEPDLERLAWVGEEALGAYADVEGNRRLSAVARWFVPGLCAYHPEQVKLLQGVERVSALIGGLGMGGDYLRGCSIEGCFAAAEEAVRGLWGRGSG